MGVPPAKIALMRGAAMRPASLDSPVGDESSPQLGELVSDENAILPDRELSDKNISTILRSLIGELPDGRCRFWFAASASTERRNRRLRRSASILASHASGFVSCRTLL